MFEPVSNLERSIRAFRAMSFGVVLLGALIGGCSEGDRERSMTGVSSDMVTAINRLLEAEASDAFLVVSIRSTGDFIQFTAIPGTVQMDFPLITRRQQELRSKFEEACSALGLVQSVNSGSDGADFLDYDISGSPESIASAVREVLRGVFGVESDSELAFEASGFSFNGA